MSRTTVASRNTAVARPSPTILVNGDGFATNARKTPVMMSAAEVMTRPVAVIPRATDATVSPVFRYSSRMRESRNTS